MLMLIVVLDVVLYTDNRLAGMHGPLPDVLHVLI
jgi:hypothetical protein